MAKRVPFHPDHKTPITEAAIAPAPWTDVRILRSDASTPMKSRFAKELNLDKDLLGPHATSNRDEAPVLSCSSGEVLVNVRKMDRYVFGIPGRTFEDLPGHPGSMGRYWTWVAHPDQNEMLAFIPRRRLSVEGRLRLYRLQCRPLRGDTSTPLRISPPCIVVAGLGAVELAVDAGSTRLTKPEPVATFEPEKLRNQLDLLSWSTSRLALPCVVPNTPYWLHDEKQAVLRLTETLDAAYKQDPPDWLLLPCYLPDSTPGLIVARRVNHEWVFVSTNLALRTLHTSDRCIDSATKAEIFTAPLETARIQSPSPISEGTPPPFIWGEYTVHFENRTILMAARDKVLAGAEYTLDERRYRPASAGALRRAACVYALQLSPVDIRDLRLCGWSERMAKCVEDFADNIGGETILWFQKKDGPQAFAQFFTVRRKGNIASNATEALAVMLDKLVRPHGRVRVG